MKMKLMVTLGVLIFTVNVTGASRLICPTQPIKAEEGDVVTLPCHVDPPRNVSAYTMDWKRVELDKVVYVYRHGRHYNDEPLERYRNRTTFNLDGPSRGNLTLQISSAQLNDSGLYRCFVSKLNTNFCVVNVSVVTKDQQNMTNRGGDATKTTPPVEDVANMRTYYPTVVTIVGFIIVIIGLLVKSGTIKKCRREQEAEMAPNDVQMENLNPEAAEEDEDLDITVENIQQEV